jgi:hypothetical protein
MVFAISLGPIMECYDVVLLSSFYGLNKFADKWVESLRICVNTADNDTAGTVQLV